MEAKVIAMNIYQVLLIILKALWFIVYNVVKLIVLLVKAYFKLLLAILLLILSVTCISSWTTFSKRKY